MHHVFLSFVDLHILKSKKRLIFVHHVVWFLRYRDCGSLPLKMWDSPSNIHWKASNLSIVARSYHLKRYLTFLDNHQWCGLNNLVTVKCSVIPASVLCWLFSFNCSEALPDLKYEVDRQLLPVSFRVKHVSRLSFYIFSSRSLRDIVFVCWLASCSYTTQKKEYANINVYNKLSPDCKRL